MTCRVAPAAASACSIARTGVAPIPALSSTIGRSPGCRTKSPRGELTSRRSPTRIRSEEHTSELQSHHDLVCRLLLEKNKTAKGPSRSFEQKLPAKLTKNF